MNNLEIELIGLYDSSNYLTINGTSPKIKKLKNNNAVCNFETKENTAEIIIYKTHQYVGKNWFWWSLLYFVISFFGIFDIRHDKRCLVVDCRFKLNLKENTKVVISKLDFENGGKFAEIQSEETIEEICNINYNDKEAKKRHNVMKKVKIAFAFLTLALIVALILLI